MFLKLKDGRKLNLFYLSDCFVGKHDKTIVIFYLVNSTKLLEGYATPKEAEDRVKEVNEAMEAARGGGLVQKDTFSDFPDKGNKGFVYIAKDTGQTYYWDPVSKTYVKTGTAGRTGVYSYNKDLPSVVGTSIVVKKSELNEILKPTVDFSEGSEVIGDNAIHGIITNVNGDNVTITTVTDLTIDSFRQVATLNDLPTSGVDNILYYVQDIDEFRIWDETNKKWVKPFHPIIFHDEKIADAKLNTLYVAGNTIKYTTDNVNWIEIDSEHPLKFVDIPVANAKIGTIYIVGDKARYTTDNVNWTYLDSDHPIIFGDSPVASAKLNTLYVDGNTIKYTTDNVTWVEISGGAAMKEYLSDVDLITTILGKTTVNITDISVSNINDVELEQLVYDNKGTVGRITKIDPTTKDIEVETITIADSGSGAPGMPIAPDTKELKIKNGGNGYAVGDIVESTTTGIFAEVTSVDSNGIILDVTDTTATAQSTSGTGAVIDYEQIIYGGYGTNWAALSDAAVLVAQALADKFEYETGYDFNITNAGTGYSIGDVIATDVTDINVIVTNVNSNGEIQSVDYTRNSVNTTTGTGATIAAQPNSNIFIIPKEYWNNGTALFSLVNDEGAQVEFYRTGDVLVKYNAGADSNIYKFTYNEVNGTIKQEAVKISGGDSKLIRNVKANVSAGAISSGDTVLKDTTFTEFVEKLLIKEIAPSINVTATNSGVYVVNTQIGGTTINLKINSLGTSTPTSIEFYIDGTLIDTQAYTAGKMSYSTDYSTVITSATPKTITATAKLIYDKSDGNTTNVLGNKTIVFVYPSFSGVTSLDSTTITEADIKAMTKLALASKFYTASGITMSNQRTIFVYPQTYGNLTSIKDANNFEYLQSYDKTTITIDGVLCNAYTLHDPVTVINFKQIYN